MNIWENHRDFFKQQDCKPKTVLLKEGEISKKIYYIEKGCLRVWFNNEGKEITFQFFFEGQFFSGIESFWTNQPSLYTIETIEACTVHSITKKDFQTIYNSSEKIRQEFELYIFKRLISYQRLFLSRIKDSPEKRYIQLLEDHPSILQRIPQHYIASYLGITPVSLSRIRNRR